MNTRTTFWSGAAAATVVALLASQAAASPAALALYPSLGATAVTCRAAIAKSYGKLVKTANKTIAGCHKNRDKGNGDVNCNDMAIADAEKGKYAGAVVKFTAAVDAACGTGLDSTMTSLSDDFQYYVSCPVTCPGVPNPITAMTQVSDCLGCLAGVKAGEIAAATMGLPALPLSSADQKCHGAIGKGYGKYMATALKAETSCQGDADEVGNNDLSGCEGADPKFKVDGAETKASDGLESACTAPITSLGGCATDTVPNLIACTQAAWAAAEDEAFTSIYELEGTICPAAIRTTILGGCSTQGDAAGNCSLGNESSTVLSVGWMGPGHGIDVTDSYTLAGDISCAGSEAGSCGPCDIVGISTDNPQYYAFTRCTDEPYKECSNPFGTDVACGAQCLGGSPPFNVCTSNDDCIGGNTCTAAACSYFLGPPLSVMAGSTATCTHNIVNSDIDEGTVDPDAGTADFTVDLKSRVHLGVSSVHPCPWCSGDPAPKDGNRTGTCVGGSNPGAVCTSDFTCTGGGNCTGDFGTCTGGSSRDGQPCDVQGFDLNFSTTDAENPTDGPSLDCPMAIGADISSGGLTIALPLSTGFIDKSADDDCDGALPPHNSPPFGPGCFCGACSGNNTVGCDLDSDCALLGLGTCDNTGGEPRKPNNCSDGTCVPESSDRGLCSNTPDYDKYCDGVLFANGHGILTCFTNGDCDANSTICPTMCLSGPNGFIPCSDNSDCGGGSCSGDCGNCNLFTVRSCYNNPIEITGVPDTNTPTLAGIFCLPPSSNTGVNSTVGTPGPGVVEAESIVERRF